MCTAMLLLAVALATIVANVESHRLGCFVDRGHGRDLPVIVHSRHSTNRHYCLNYCRARGYRYFGLQAGDWCHCGNSYGRYGRARDSDCHRRCWGDRSQTCGGEWRNEVFTTDIQSTDGIRIGCYEDRGHRDLSIALKAGNHNTKEFCVNFCRSRGYMYAGLQAGDWCNCGNSYGRYRKVSDSECGSSCFGDRSRTCGGGWRNEIFTTGGSGSRTLTNRIGCYADRSSRDMSLTFRSGARTERNFCINYCKSRGYRYAGLQAGDWCSCGNSYGRYGRAQDVDCHRQCWGDPHQTCGGEWRNEIFSTAIHSADGVRMGCYEDRGHRDLSIALKAGNHNTKEFCVNFCRSRGYMYAGLQAGDWCNCGNSYGRYRKVSDSECGSPCFGDRSRTCGGGWRNEIFTTGGSGSRTLTNRIGCYVDKASRDMSHTFHSGKRTERNFCVSYCKSRGYRYAGLQAGDWCTCGNKFGRYGKAQDVDCHRQCWGDPSQTCGGEWRNEIFSTGIRESDGIRVGCYEDKGNGRDLPIALRSGSHSKRQFCINFCRSRGYKFAGLQAGDWCMCGNSYGRYRKVSDSECNVACFGDRSQKCGGRWRNEIFTTGATGKRALTSRIGCYVDKASRDMSHTFHSGKRTERNFCVSYCKSRGYRYAGLQAGDWCTCGNKFGRYGKAQDVDCYRQCWGDPSQTCGGEWRNEIFSTGIKKSDGIRLGCFKDKSERDLPLALKAGTRTTKQFCVNYCKTRNFRFASVQAGDWCHCGNSYGRYGRLADSECQRKCWGDRSQTCGGDWRNEVFTTGAKGKVFKHIGCYEDSADQPDLTLHAGTSAVMSLGKCLHLCKRAGKLYFYFAVQNGSQCFCGEQYGSYGVADAKKCNKHCKGNSSQVCGGDGFNSVYSIQ